MTVIATGGVTLTSGHFEVEDSNSKVCDIDIQFKSMGASSYEVFGPDGISEHKGKVTMPDGSKKSYVRAINEILSTHGYPAADEVLVN